MDIKKMIEEAVEKIRKNPELLTKLDNEPIPVLEKLLGMDLPDELVEQLIDGIKAKLAVENVGDVLGSLGGLFGKK